MHELSDAEEGVAQGKDRRQAGSQASTFWVVQFFSELAQADERDQELVKAIDSLNVSSEDLDHLVLALR